MTRRKSFLILITIFGLSLLLLWQFSHLSGSNLPPATSEIDGGANPGTAPSENKDKITLQISVAVSEEEWNVLQSLSKEYMNQHEDIIISLTNVAMEEAYSAWKKAGQMSEMADILLLDNAWVHEFAALGYLHPMNEWVSDDKPSQWPEVVVGQVKWNGYLWGVPKDVDPYIFVWNKQTAEQQQWGNAPESLIELALWNETMMNASTEQGESYGVFVDLADPYALVALLSTLNVPFPADGSPANLLKEDELVQRLEQFLLPGETEWSNEAFVKQYKPLQDKAERWKALQEGRMAGMIASIADFKRNETEDLAIAALPVQAEDKDNLGGLLKGHSFAISSKSQYASEAMMWIHAMTTQDSDLSFWLQQQQLPAKSATFESLPFMEDPLIDSYKWLIQEGRVLPVDIDLAKKLDALTKGLHKLTTGEMDVRLFADDVIATW